MFIRVVILCALFFPQMGTAASRYESQIRSALEFLNHYQTTGDDGYHPGQWRSRVTSYAPSAVGVGKFGIPFEEPSVFSATVVANILAEIYFLNPKYKELPSLIFKTQAGLDPYRWNNHLFSFYPSKYYRGVKIVGPKYMYLAKPWWGFANVPPDADTNAATYIYLHHLESLRRGLLPEKFNAHVASEFLNTLSHTRDLHRRPHTYNLAQGHINTGAYLTYMLDENDPIMPRFPFTPPDKGPRIPFAKNDLDCVVNANLLKLLTLAGKTQMPGYQASCHHLQKVVKLRQNFFCGMYYPSLYALPYSMAAAIESGASCLEPSRDELVHFLIKKQNADGSWRNSILARPDLIQSSAWALNSFLLLADPQNSQHRKVAQRGIQFLLSQMQKDSSGRSFWKGEVFFAAIFVARFNVVWRSSAYTTALVTKALVLADQRWKL